MSIVALIEKRISMMEPKKIIIIGAGIGGLSAALKLAHQGYSVDVFDTHETAGGKMRTIPSSAGLVDAGPTVFTLKHLFDELFQDVGEKIEDHLQISKEKILARHFWRDGSTLNLYNDIDHTCSEIIRFSGNRAADEFRKFNSITKDLFSTFDEPILKSASPSMLITATNTFTRLNKIASALLPGRTLNNLVQGIFTDTRLQQLFSRYSTYVGGSPYSSPAILSLIWQAEALGVWRINGGMHRLAQTLKKMAEKRGAIFHFKSKVSNIVVNKNRVAGIRLLNGKEFYSNHVIFNGDPKALHEGLLGDDVKRSVSKKNVNNRSLSAYVWTFSAKTCKQDLTHHNVFFNEDYRSEFSDISAGIMPRDPTLYVCAQDRGKVIAGQDEEKFEIIMNAAPVTKETYLREKEYTSCRETTFGNLKAMGLTFDRVPPRDALTTPRKFDQMFPASNGSLYGLNPSNIMATFVRPQSRVKPAGLYLAGGGVHPGPGVPMAMLSGKHAAAAIIRDQTLD